MLPNYAHLLTDFRTVFVFGLEPFLPMLMIFLTSMGILMGKWPKSMKWPKITFRGPNVVGLKQ